MPTKYPQAKLAADNIIYQYGLSSPVKVFDLGDTMGINWDVLSSVELQDKIGEHGDEERVKDLDILDVLGYFASKDDTFYINDDNNPIVRRRFTFAHELGHYVLHKNMSQNLFRIVTKDDLNSLNTSEETEANFFASYLLMPDKDIKIRLILLGDSQSKKEVNSLLAELFVVSEQAVEHRLDTYRFENPETWREYKVSKIYV